MTMEQTTETDRPARRHMNKADVVQKRHINRLLENPQILIVESTAAPGAKVPRGRYAEGWSDDRVAQEVGVSVKNVVSIRTRAFCSLLTPRTPDKAPRVGRESLAALEERLTALVKSEVAAVLELIAARPASGGAVSDDRLKLVIDRVNALDEQQASIDGKLNSTRAMITSVQGDCARIRSELRQLTPAR